MKIFNELGTFWIPKYGEKKFCALLKEDNNNFYLNSKDEFLSYEEYIPLLNGINGSAHEKIKEEFLILGWINDIPVTLIALPFSCFSCFRISMVLENIHLKSLKNIKFKKVKLYVNNINNFVKSINVDKESIENEENNSFEYKVIYKSFGLEKITLKKFELRLEPNFSSKLDNDLRSFNINEKITINLEYFHEEEFVEIQKDIRHLEKFFSLILKKSLISEIEVKSASIEKNNKIKIFTPKIAKALNNKNIHSMFKTLFKFEDITNPNVLFKNWFDKYDVLKPFYDLYFSTILSDNYAETDLISYTQALESYYRNNKRFKTEYHTEKDFTTLEHDLKSSVENCFENFSFFKIDEEYKDKLLDIIQYTNQYSLISMLRRLLKELNFTKINEILENYSQEKILLEKFFSTFNFHKMNKILYSSENKRRKKKINNFAKIITDTRNYYTHYGGTRQKSSELLYLNKELKCIIEICFMKELGISNEQIEKITENIHRFDVSHRETYTTLI